MIKWEKCTIYFKKEILVNNVTLAIKKNSFFCLIGESGGGKTLLSKMLLGLLPKGFTTEGDIYCDLEKTELVLQNPLGTMQNNIVISKQFHHLLKSRGIIKKNERDKMVIEIMRNIGFLEISETLKKKPHELSGGMCQKIALAFALILNPEIIIADEITSALDKHTEKKILEILQRLHCEKKTTIFFITHDLNIVKKYSSHIGIMKEGRLIEVGKTSEVIENPQENYTKELIQLFGEKY